MTDSLRDQLQTALGPAYNLARELDGGGMSRVFVAHEAALRRDVVVKVLAPELAEGLSAARFTREIQLAAGLQQAHIVPVLAAGVTSEGLPYYTMPYVDGESLRRRMANASLTVAESVGILRDVAQALAYAHKRGIVHRDIKPENILLSGGSAVVADFGIAKALAAATTHATDGSPAQTAGLTQRGTALGTPAYMAPEQAAADPATDHRADVYAWGVVAFELLAGQHPFAGCTSSQQLMAAHFTQVPAPLPSPPVPAALSALVARCLAKDPADRPASATELLAALDVERVPTDRIATTPQRGWVRNWQFLGGALVVLVVLGGAYASRRARSAASRVPTTSDAPPLVAVLPFEMPSGAAGVPVDSAFADGLGDAITGKLARLQGLRVIDRASVRSVENAAARPQAAGRTLGADFVLRATLRWARGADGQSVVQVSPVLVRVSDGTTRWAGEPTVVTPADAFTVQGTLATEVADALNIALAPVERATLAAAITNDTAAFAAIERGRQILEARDTLTRTQRYQRALREFEFAYLRDPSASDAWSQAGTVLWNRGQIEGNAALLDSGYTLSRHALVLDPGNLNAVAGVAVFEITRGNAAAGRAVIERAVRAHPSSAEARGMLAEVQSLGGDSANAWPTAREALRLAPRSLDVLDGSLKVALMQNRFAEADELVARRRALDPTSRTNDVAVAFIAAARGDSTEVARALRAYQQKGGKFQIEERNVRNSLSAFDLLSYGDRAAGEMLLAGTPGTFGVHDAMDSVYFYSRQAELLLQIGESARAQRLLGRGRAILHRLIAGIQTPSEGANLGAWLSWFAAAQQDRAGADSALTAYATVHAAVIRDSPGGFFDATLTCARAEAAGLLGDVTTMLQPLRRCLTMTNGRSLSELQWNPAFSRHARDARVRALAVELKEAEQRARSAPVQVTR